MQLKEFCRNNILVLDGAMGTMLQAQGLAPGQNPEAFNLTRPEIVGAVHKAYLEAGSKLILTNTFGANAKKLKKTGFSVEEVIQQALAIALEAAAPHHSFVALDIGPLGELLEPMGTLSFEDAYDLFKQQVLAGVASGAQAIYIETMTDLYELKAAVLAAKEHSDLPVFATMSFEKNQRTFLGTSLSAMALTMEGLGVDFLGINCSLGPAELYPMVQELQKWTSLPLIIKPNAGLPTLIDNQTVYNITPQQFGTEMQKILKLGVAVVGGCCGTSPQFIALLSQIAKSFTPVTRQPVAVAAVCSGSKTVTIDQVRIIGERINPTGKKLFQAALKNQDLDYILSQGIEQVEAGADILDINVGLPGLDEKSLMIKTVKAVQSIITAPLQIDSSDPQVLEAALRVYNGKPIINSVNGEGKSLATILPLAKKYGAAVVGLTLDQRGIPKTAGERLAIAQTIVEAAQAYGIPKSNIFIDCLTLTAGAEQEIAYEALKAVALIKEHLQVKTVLGVSNISFGLPDRPKLNQVFLSLALGQGLDLPILNPNLAPMIDTVYCFQQLNNTDKGSRAYLARFGAEATQHALPSAFAAKTGEAGIDFAIQKGLQEETKIYCKELLQQYEPLEVISKFLIPCLDEVGKKYETNQIFLPQLLQAAEAAKAAFQLLRQALAARAVATGIPQEEAQTAIILATVQGDIHDIGKNIVKVVLENYGYPVLDLGKDVSIAEIVKAAKENPTALVGLSALMTTTVANMGATIEALKAQNSNQKIMVGGAVLTPSYAQELQADFYAKDAMSAVAIANQVLQGNR